MASLSQVVGYLDEQLESWRFTDSSLNGLQIEGRGEVRRVVLGVSASLKLFEEAIAWGADAVVVHHGLLWDGPQRIIGPLARRVRALLASEVSLLAYHLPLDAHPVDGNNALLAKRMGLSGIERWGKYRNTTIGALGTLEGEPRARELAAALAVLCGAEPIVLGDGERRVRRVAVCSGSGGSMLDQAVAAGADALVTGEPGEPSQQLALETGVVVLAAGHYNTERLGLQAIGQRLVEVLGLEVRFVEIPNPI